MEEFADVFAQARACVAVVAAEILQVGLEAFEREFLVIAARAWFDGQQPTAFGIKDEQQPVEVDQAAFIECFTSFVGVRDVVLKTRGKTIGKIGKDGEDALTEVLLKFRLCAEGLLANAIKSALALGVTLQRGRRKECEKEFEIFQ